MTTNTTSDLPSSPEDGGNFRRSLQIDMKGLVGDAVGNMSISPGSRDVVLAARKGLFIIDLENPLNVPRFLPQGGTWDVADVQWNPHMSHKQYIVSTSSEKLLIWNLYVSGKTSIEHILRSHYRAITDINWHTTDPDIVVSTGIDSWLWAWDLRTTSKPVIGLCAFNAGATQVKWNRSDGNLLASSHMNEVLIWDRRKGSLPVTRLKAHGSKIYGIDWAHHKRDEIVTCSLDKTIKVWDIQKVHAEEHTEPTFTIHTSYPIWRARNLPFGEGILSLPQRSETALELWTPQDHYEPLERFEGHTDVVKEFVWRKGGEGNNEFQLITWSKDRSLRFWPVEQEIMEKVGKPTNKEKETTTAPQYFDQHTSFSSAPEGSERLPTLSAPVGHRSILAGVRASQPGRPHKTSLIGPKGSQDLGVTRSFSQVTQEAGSLNNEAKGSTMSRGYVGGRSAQITTVQWLSSVKVGSKREGSDPYSGGESGNVSRYGSRSRPPSIMDPSGSMLDLRGRKGKSGSRDRDEDEHRESGETNQTLKEEITSVVNKLTASKVKLEKADLAKRRSCTFGLHGPWGESTSVFIRITFIFPRDYPQALHPAGTPQVELERNPLIPVKSRVHILRRLHAIRQQQRPCLEACLRFLLFGDSDDDYRPSAMDDSDSSDDEMSAIPRRVKDGAFAVPRSDKNLAEPRTSQGVFGPNGQLVCFFRAPPRIVRHALQEAATSPSAVARNVDPAPRLFWSPILLSDAMRKLALAAKDREVDSIDVKRAEDAHGILRIMSNLFTIPQQKTRRVSDQSRPSLDEAPKNYALLPTLRSTIFIKDAAPLVGLDVGAAYDYVFPAANPVDACKKNVETARLRGRVDHERVFNVLQIFMIEHEKGDSSSLAPSLYSLCNPLIVSMIEKLYNELSMQKDIQMLTMLSIVLLRLANELPTTSISPSPHRLGAHWDYFNFKQTSLLRTNATSPVWAHGSPSPAGIPLAPALSSPSSSRGSWSSLFNASSMRRFINASRTGMPITHHHPHPSPRSPVVRDLRRESPSPVVSTPAARSWHDTAIDRSSPKQVVSFSSAGHRSRRPTFSQVVTTGLQNEEKKRVVAEIVPQMKLQRSMFRLQPKMRQQLHAHIWVYAEMLTAWQLPQKRAELLKATSGDVFMNPILPALLDVLGSSPLGVARTCAVCSQVNEPSAESCAACGGKFIREGCSVCRLPIKGLSHTCLNCLHATHLRCWKARKDSNCATGCGCRCAPASESQSTRTAYSRASSRFASHRFEEN
ncbi:hypothetical protein BDW22DRAFT_1354052 [Trametopsis cervina]|nr:hypothetical protein BDW22DRAFT_1354052 [Trametopsis cervina]